jgi:hypothetical protein
MKASWRAGYSCIVYLDVMDDQGLDEAKLKLEYFLIMGLPSILSCMICMLRMPAS